jgi:serine/threonine protein kinase
VERPPSALNCVSMVTGPKAAVPRPPCSLSRFVLCKCRGIFYSEFTCRDWNLRLRTLEPLTRLNTPSQSGRTSGGQPPWEPPSPEELSAALPAYEVTALLGRGGMGAVYRAVQRSLKREVAIKVLAPAADDELKFAERFRHEAETLARLNHPGIVHIHDFGETADGLLYLVMEYVDGTDVHRLIQGERTAQRRLRTRRYRPRL